MPEGLAALWTQAASTSSLDTQHLILQVVGVVLGGGLLQLILFLLKRRATLRSLDTASDATQLASANDYITILTGDAKTLRGEVDSLKQEIAAMKRSASIAADDAVRNMATAEATVTRLTTDLARARTDVAVMRSELDDIAAGRRRPLPGGYYGGGSVHGDPGGHGP